MDAAIYRAQGGKLPIKWMALETLKLNEYTSASDVYELYVKTWNVIFTVGHSVFCYTNYSQWATHHIRPFNHPIWSNIWKAENDCRNPNHYARRKCILFNTNYMGLNWKCFRYDLMLVVLECGSKWTTAICRYSTKICRNYKRQYLITKVIIYSLWDI